jgi:hypothetical protein
MGLLDDFTDRHVEHGVFTPSVGLYFTKASLA